MFDAHWGISQSAIFDKPSGPPTVTLKDLDDVVPGVSMTYTSDACLLCVDISL